MKKLLCAMITLAAILGHTTSVQAQDAKKGEGKAAMCIGCHGIPGYQASFPEIGRAHV